MHFLTPRLLATLLAAATASLANPVSLPDPEAFPDPELVARAAKTGHTCAGDYDGSPLAALACVDTKWTTKQKISARLAVRDSKKDGNPTYGWYRVYWADGTKKDYEKKLINNGGSGNTVYSSWRSISRSGVEITGVRAWACVDDFGPDSCEAGDFLRWGVKDNV